MNSVKLVLALKDRKSIGPVAIKKLRDTFSSPLDILKLSKKDLTNSLPPSISKPLLDINNTDLDVYQNEIDIATKNNVTLISIWDPKYPRSLLGTPNPPPVLYVKGNLELNKIKMVSIIGTRKPSDYGKTFAHELAKFLAENGYTIVSGMAKGIDQQAHAGALQPVSGKTIAVLGCGLSKSNSYLKANQNFINQIEKSGTIISESPMDSITNAWRLKSRNRIITGLSVATVVIEGSLKSGSLSSANHAKKQNKPLICLQPKDISIKEAQLPIKLIEEGAIPINKIDDSILSTLDSLSTKSKSQQMQFADFKT